MSATGGAGQYLKQVTAGGAVSVETIPVKDVPDLGASKITSDRFGMARMPDGTSGYVLTAKGAGVDPAYEDVAGLRVATKIVAASNSLDKTRADYVCSGQNDQTEINSAISDLGVTGGRVLLLEGTYNITGPINLASLVALVGQGAGTVLRIPDGFNANLNVVSALNVNRVLVQNLRIDGNKANQTAGVMRGIYFNSTTFSKISSCWIENMRGHGIFLYSSSNNNTVNGNICQGNGYHGILLYSSSNNNTVNGNICQGNGYHGIHLYSSSNNTVNGNTCQGNGNHGIYLSSSSNNNAVTGNTCLENSQSADNVYDNIRLTSSDYNLVAANVCRRGTLTNKPKYGINVSNAACNRNCIHGNDLYDSGSTSDLNDAGTSTLKCDNRNLAGTGWLAEA